MPAAKADGQYNEYIIAEYNALRTEINTLSKLRKQYILYNLAILGAILAFREKAEDFLQPGLFVFPIISGFFAYAWGHCHFRMGEIGRYIRDEIEVHSEGFAWETVFRHRSSPSVFRKNEDFAVGVFVGSQILVLLYLVWQLVAELIAHFPYFQNMTWAIFGIKVLFVLAGVFAAFFSNKAIHQRNNAESTGWWFSFATTVVFAKKEEVTQFCQGITKLCRKINNAGRPEEHIRLVEKVYMDILSLPKCPCEKSRFLDAEIPKIRAVKKRFKKKEPDMAMWWFECVRRAFKEEKNSNAVFYYPIDVSWEEGEKNTVIDAKRLRSVLQEAKHESDECLWLGGYTSDSLKDDVENQLRELLRTKYGDCITPTLRVRSEFWMITRRLFEDAVKSYKSLSYKVDDPSLWLLLFCLERNYKVKEFDLERYEQIKAPTQEDADIKYERAKVLIDKYVK